MQVPPRPCPRPAQRARPRPSARGVTALLVTVLIGVLLLFVAVAVDVARIVTAEQHLRAAADAGALAGAAVVKEDAPPYTLTKDTAIAVAQQNHVGPHPVEVGPDDVEIGYWDRDATPPRFVASGGDAGADSTQEMDAVRVWARQDASRSYGALPMTFGRLAGVSSVSLARFATAQRGPLGDPYILVLHPTKQGALLMPGNAVLEAQNGVIQVNSSHNRALWIRGSTATMTAALTRVVGGADYHPSTITGLVQEGVDPIPDPLAGLPYPDASSMALPAGPAGKIDGSQGATPWPPGRYPHGISMSSSGEQAVLAPGVYSIGPQGTANGIDLTGGRLQGSGVMLFIEQGGRVKVAGNAEVHLRPPEGGTYEGLVLFHHRQNSQNKVCDLVGLGDFHVEGTIYVAGGQLDIGGTPGKQIGRIVVNELQVRGNSGFEITGQGPPPGGEEYVFLVE